MYCICGGVWGVVKVLLGAPAVAEGPSPSVARQTVSSQCERPIVDMRCISCFIVAPLLSFCWFVFPLTVGTVRNPIRGYAKNLELLESGLWFTSDTCRQEHADVTDEITAKGEVK
jgi:hypothetical protein